MAEGPSLGERLGLALAAFFRILLDAGAAQRVKLALPPAQPVSSSQPAGDAAVVRVLSVLQREGRFVDFIREDVSSFSDADVGAAARVVHDGCRKVVGQYLDIAPLRTEAEGTTIMVPPGFDAAQIRLTGNVVGHPPFKGQLKHRGWGVQANRWPASASGSSPTVLAPAEVEL